MDVQRSQPDAFSQHVVNASPSKPDEPQTLLELVDKVREALEKQNKNKEKLER